MRFLDSPQPLVVIVGPTAVGKTDVSIQLAKRLNGEIVSADSRLFYRGMDIGTAKPTFEERQGVPHHLIDVAAPDDRWSLTIFQAAAQESIADIHARGRLPFLVGGTGQYVRAVIEGWDPPTQQPDDRLRSVLEEWAHEVGVLELHNKLALIDSRAANTIEPSNVRRTIRALEVIFRSGRRFSEQRTKRGTPYTSLMVGLKRPRVELYARIDARIELMFQAGFVDEVQGLLMKGYCANLSTLSAIGYREVSAYLRGEMTLEAAKIQMKRMTREFVRRQANWFKETDPTIRWLEMGDGVVERAETIIREV